MIDLLSPVVRNDHKHWVGDCVAWLEDVSHWQEDHQKALAELKKISQAIEAHSKTLEEHEAEIKAHKGIINVHDQTVAAYESSFITAYTLEYEAELTNVHEKEAAKHIAQRDVHERIKKHHYEVQAQLSFVLQTLECAL
jgi:chromosome segregation ATPase